MASTPGCGTRRSPSRRALDCSNAVETYRQISPFHLIRQFEAVFGVTPHQGPDDLELALEPNANPAGKAFQEAMFSQGIPLTAFEVTDIAGEFARLTAKGVAFTGKPVEAGPVTLAVFADTCGNLIQLYQPT